MQPEALIIKEIMELLRILTKELLGVQTITEFALMTAKIVD